MSFSAEHGSFRASVRAFVAAENAPHVNAWDDAETFPRELYRRAAHIGLLGLGYPEAYGGRVGNVVERLSGFGSGPRRGELRCQARRRRGV